MGRTSLVAICWLVTSLVVSSLANANSQPQQDSGGGKTASNSQQLPTIHKPKPAEENDAGCGKGQDNRKSDLCAQWKAADAAYDSAVWTARTYHLGVAGFLVGVLTLLAAGMAAKYARDAAIHTRRSADSADRMVEEANNAAEATREAMRLAERNGKLQVRAYAGINPFDIELQSVPPGAEHVSMTVVVGVRISNSGASPAYNVRVGARFKQVPWPFNLAEEKEALPSDGLPLRVVASGETAEDIRLTQRVGLSINDLRKGDKRLYIGICLIYEDVFGDTHRSEYHGLARSESLIPFLSSQGPGAVHRIETEVIPGSAVAT